MSAPWYPCEHPEKPNNAYMLWHPDCYGCHVAAVASKRRWPDDVHVENVVTLTKPRERLSLSTLFRLRPKAGQGTRSQRGEAP